MKGAEVVSPGTSDQGRDWLAFIPASLERVQGEERRKFSVLYSAAVYLCWDGQLLRIR